MRPISLFLSLAALVAFIPALHASDPVALPLWPDSPPDRVAGATPGADDGTGRFRHVGIPGMLVYRPDSPAPAGGRPALIVCPGGGYTHLTRLVGADGAVAAFLPRDFVVLSLKYRTAPPSTDIDRDALLDGLRAIRLARAHAADWGIDPGRIGLLGWSAGANLALHVASRFDRGSSASPDPVEQESSRPDFVVLLSPWPAGHVLDFYPIPADAPPAFIGTAGDDHTAPPEFARGIAAAYEKTGAPHHLLVVSAGGHGAFTIGAPGEGGNWIQKFLPWLDGLSLTGTAP